MPVAVYTGAEWELGTDKVWIMDATDQDWSDAARDASMTVRRCNAFVFNSKGPVANTEIIRFS